jgi:hypothetical protein
VGPCDFGRGLTIERVQEGVIQVRRVDEVGGELGGERPCPIVVASARHDDIHRSVGRRRRTYPEPTGMVEQKSSLAVSVAREDGSFVRGIDVVPARREEFANELGKGRLVEATEGSGELPNGDDCHSAMVWPPSVQGFRRLGGDSSTSVGTGSRPRFR